jgi:hypothetical protein
MIGFLTKSGAPGKRIQSQSSWTADFSPHPRRLAEAE